MKIITPDLQHIGDAERRRALQMQRSNSRDAARLAEAKPRRETMFLVNERSEPYRLVAAYLDDQESVARLASYYASKGDKGRCLLWARRIMDKRSFDDFRCDLRGLSLDAAHAEADVAQREEAAYLRSVASRKYDSEFLENLISGDL